MRPRRQAVPAIPTPATARRLLRAAAAAAAAVVLAGCASSDDAQLSAEQRARIDALVAEYVPDKIPGLQLGVARGGEVLYQKGYGLADVARGQPMTESTPVRIGSVTKQFTAAAALRLHQQGRLSLDDPLTRWLPELKYPATPNVRQLVQMVAGVPGDDDSDVMGTAIQTLQEPPPSDAVLFERINRHGPVAPPGARFEYANAGYSLLGLVIERASGKALVPAMDELLFQPAGMTQTFMYSGTKRADAAAGHFRVRPGEPWRQCPDLNSGYAASGGLVATVADLARWNGALRAGRIISPELLALMRTNAPLTGGGQAPIGMGVVTLGPGVGYGAAGQTVQYAAWNATYDSGLDVSLLVNGSNNERDAIYPRAALAARIHNVVSPDRPVPVPATPPAGGGAEPQALAELLAVCR